MTQGKEEIYPTSEPDKSVMYVKGANSELADAKLEELIVKEEMRIVIGSLLERVRELENKVNTLWKKRNQ